MQFSHSTATVIDFEHYLKVLHRVGDVNDVYVFPRFEMMRYWSEQNVFNFDGVAKDERAKPCRQGLRVHRQQAGGSDPARAAMRGFLPSGCSPRRLPAGMEHARACRRPAGNRFRNSAELRDPPALSAIDVALERTGSRIRPGKSLTIVAIGSSSTQGVGATGPTLSYPSRLQQELKAGIRTRDKGRSTTGSAAKMWARSWAGSTGT